jgi:hypothetical protein
VFFDGRELSLQRRPGARRFRLDPRCVAGEPVHGYAHVCAVTDREAAIRFDEPEVQQARRDALAWWIPMLAGSLICISTLSIDASRFGGAITVVRERIHLEADPFARLFAGTVVETDLFCAVDPPPGPVIERYGGAPWPAGGF